MKCPKCKKNISSLSEYCNYCGKKIKNNIDSNIFSYSFIKEYYKLIKPKVNTTTNNYSKTVKQKNTIKENEYNTILNNYPNSHQEQVAYSAAYSGVSKPKANTHQDQVAYSAAYSGVSKPKANTHQDQHDYSKTYSKSSQIIVTSDEDYIKTFVGKNYDKIKKEKFSIPTLLLGGIHLYYRKMYILGSIWLVINAISLFSSEALFLTNIFLAAIFPKIYLYTAKLKVSHIKTSNPDKSSSELIEECKNKGGIDLRTPIITGIILYFLIAIISSYTENKVYYDNGIQEETVDTLEELSYTIPENFEENYSTTYEKSYVDEDNYLCSFKIKVLKYPHGYTNEYQYLSVINNSNNTNAQMINNEQWIYTYDYFDKHHYYVKLYNNVNLYQFDYLENTDQECNNKINNVKNSLDFTNYNN